jgi:hypothetical protein
VSRRNEWNEPARYYIMRGGRIIRRPHEDFKPIDPNSPFMKLDYAKLEGDILDKLMKERK